jgi:hypothetical protein
MPLAILSLENQRARRDVAQDATYISAMIEKMLQSFGMINMN